MPTTYKGLTIPVAADLADGPTAFAAYTDTLPSQVFANQAALLAFTTAIAGSTAVTADNGHRWVNRAGVWSDTTLQHAPKTLSNVAVGASPVGLGTLAIPAVPYARVLQVSLMTIIDGAPTSMYQVYFTCAGNTFYSRGMGDGSSIIIPVVSIDLPGAAVGDVVATGQRITSGPTNGTVSGDGRYSRMDVTYRGV